MTTQPARPGDSSASHDPGERSHDRREAELGGGVSSDIRIAQSPQGPFVIKRALRKLKVKADWFSDPARSSTEARGLCTIARLLGQAHLPKVLWVDEASHRFAMELIAPRFGNWKRQLLRGDIDLATARTAGRLLGELHARSSVDPTLAAEFADTRTFVELRIRPFFERIADRNPSLRAAVSDIVRNIHASRHALVHGDYSPKNLLADGADVVVLDCEVVHWGDARFDVAFCIAHLLLKSFRRDAPTPVVLAAALAFLSEYRRSGLPVLDAHFLRQLGCLLLARLEGDSPVDYLDDLDADAVKQLAIELILRPPPSGDPDFFNLTGGAA